MINRILKILGWIFIPFVMVYVEIKKNNTNAKSVMMAGAVLLWWLSAVGSANNAGIKNLQSKIDSKNTKIEELNNKVLELKSDLSSTKDKLDTAENKYFNEKQSKQTATKSSTPVPTSPPTSPPTPVKTEALKEYTFSSGNFVAGKDFVGGTYDIIAVSGSGNVNSDNMYSGGINAIMGVQNDDMYVKEYKNIKLPKGTTLKIDRVTIKLVKK